MMTSSKSSWWTKYKDPEIREKWTQECLDAQYDDINLDPPHVEYLLAELAEYEKARVEEGQIQVHPTFTSP